MRTKKALLNSGSALLLELVTIVCGFILPRLILATFGSKYNGITSSITQFLSYIALLKSGIGGVTRASLYKPLQEKDTESVSAIVKATEQFMRRVAMIFAVAIVAFAAIYPFAVLKDFSWGFSFSLVLILGVGTFSQYYFGITYQMLLQADQRQYISSVIQIVTTIANTMVAAILIKIGCSIHIVKLGSAIVFTLNPVFISIYVRKKYGIIRKIEPNKAAIAQRWDSFAHQIANFVHGNTDVVILTLFASLTEVSVYTVYAMVVTGVRKLVNTLATGMEAAFGNMLAKKEDKILHKNLELLEFIIFYVAGFCFSCAIVLIVPFVGVYTSGIHDADYIRPAFGVLLCVAELLWCIRIPYQSVVLAAGRFRETRNGAIAEPLINIAVSVALVFKFGIIGVAIGTVTAMAFRTVQYAVYMSKNIVQRSIWIFVKKLVIAACNMTISCFLALLIDRPCSGYGEWILLALMRAGIILAVNGAFIAVFENKNFIFFWKKIAGLKKKESVARSEASARDTERHSIPMKTTSQTRNNQIQSKTEQTVFRILKASLFQDEAFAVPDWKSVFHEMEEQAVAALPGEWLKKHPITEASAWSSYCVLQQGRWIQTMCGQDQLLCLLEQNGIPCVIIKGAASAMTYPQPSLRTMGDVDFLVRRNDLEKAAQILESNGYTLTHDKDHVGHHYNYEKDRISYELHKRLPIIQDSDERLLKLFEEGIEKREWRETAGHRFPVLPGWLNGLVLIFHINQHFRDGLGLRQILDWMMYANVMPDSDWKLLLQELRRNGMEKLALTVTAMCQQFLGLRTIVENPEAYPCDRLMAHIIEKGNFGRKAGIDGKTAAFALSSTEKKGFFKRLQAGGLGQWKAARRHRILRPFAWIYQAFRIFGMLFKNRIGFKELADQKKKGREQRELIDSLGLSVDKMISERNERSDE